MGKKIFQDIVVNMATPSIDVLEKWQERIQVPYLVSERL